MALDKDKDMDTGCRVLPKSHILNNGVGDREYGIPNENDSSDSDSGNSIFLTQADPLALPLRKVRRRHGAPSKSCTSSLSESTDSESEEARSSFEPHSETANRQDASSCKNKLRPAILSVPKRTIHFPFLEKYYGRTCLTWHQQQTIVNSSIGGFFQCMENITAKSKKPESSLTSGSAISYSDEETEDLEDQDNQDDIRIVNSALFVENLRKRDRREWCSNTKKAPSKKKRSHTKDVSKAPVTAQSTRSKQSSRSEVKKTRRAQTTKGVSETTGTLQGPIRRSQRQAVKRTYAQNLANYDSCSSSEEGSETSQTGRHQKTRSRVTSQPADASVKDKREMENRSSEDIATSSTFDAEALSQKKKGTVDKDHTDTVEGSCRLAASQSCGQLGQSETVICPEAVQGDDESLSQEHTGNGSGASHPQPKTLIQLTAENDVASSHDSEMQSVDGDPSSAKEKRKKKKKKREKDYMESVDECSALREMISISQDVTVSSAPETEIGILSQKKRKKHKRKENCVQQDNQEPVNYQPEGQRDQQDKGGTKDEKKVSNALSPPAFSTTVDSQMSSSQVYEVSDFDGNSVTLNTSAKKKKKRKKDMKSLTEESCSHNDACSFSPENQVTFLQEAVPKKKKKKRKHDREQCVLEDGTHLVSDDQRPVQQTGTETQQTQVSPDQAVKPSDGSDGGGKRKKEDGCGVSPNNVCSTTNAGSEVCIKKKKKKKRHKSENSCELGITTSEDNGSQVLQEVHEGERSCTIARSSEKEMDEVQVYSSAPEGLHAEQRERPIKEKRKKKKRDTLLDTADVNPEETLSISLVPHTKKKKKKRHDETGNELKDSVVSAGLQSVVNDIGIPDLTKNEQRLDDGPAMLNTEREEKRKKKKKSKH